MTVKSDLEKAKAAATAAQGTYETFAAATNNQTAKEMFQQMAQDMERHVSNIDNRISSTSENLLVNMDK